MPRLERVEQALAWARDVLAGAPDVEPLDAALLLMHVLGVSRAALLAHPEMPLSRDQAAVYGALVRQRAAGMPVAYLLGRRAFYDREFAVTPDVLIPRPETEHLVEAVLDWARAREVRTLVDVGTGSGAIAVTLAANLPAVRCWAVDVCPEAVAVARQNVEMHGLAARVTVLHGDLLEPVQAAGLCADVIAANLPYIPTGDLADLAVARREPRLALDGGADGLDVIRRLLDQAPGVLAAGGLLALEIGAGQGQAVVELAAQVFPGARIDVRRDYAGHERVVTVERRG